jgi:hypothetical protein
MIEVIADYPAYCITNGVGQQFKDGDEFAVAFESARYGTMWNFFKLGSLADFYKDLPADEAATKIEASKAKGNAEFFAFGLGVSLTAWKQDKKTVPGFQYGQVIEFNGRQFELVKAPNSNVNLKPIKSAAQKIEELEAIVGLMLLAFPDETIQDGQRFKVDQVRRMNAAIIKGKEYIAARNQG